MGKPKYRVQIKIPNHPFANKKQLIVRARAVMEEWLREHDPCSIYLVDVNGEKYLDKAVVVHHKDFDYSNDTIENLQIFPSNGEHSRYHRLQECPIIECNVCKKKVRSYSGLCKPCYKKIYYKDYVRPIKKCTQCERITPTHARGLCPLCYQKSSWLKRQKGICSECSKEIDIFALGRCRTCYEKQQGVKYRASQVGKVCIVCGESKYKIRSYSTCNRCHHLKNKNIQTS